MERMVITADVIPLSQCETEVGSNLIQLSQQQKKQKKKIPSRKRKKNHDDDEDDIRKTARVYLAVDILSGGGYAKPIEKKNSMTSHFDFFSKIKIREYLK